MEVGDTEEHDGAPLDAVEQRVRKPPCDCPANLAVKRLILERVLGNAMQGSVYLCNELTTQAGSL
jgi:hypothetical protein